MNSAPTDQPLPLPKKEGERFAFRGKGYRVQLYQLSYGAFHWFFRTTEKLTGAFACLLFSAVLFMVEFRSRQRDYPNFVRLRSALPPSIWKGLSASRHYWGMIWRWLISGATVLAYPRLAKPYWNKRFTIAGTPPEELPDWDKRPVVLVTLHYGAFGLIPYWLRSRGIPSAFVMGSLPPILDNEYYLNLRTMADRAYGLERVPHTFARRGPAVRDAVRFLKPGHILIMALDGGRLTPETDTRYVDGVPILVKSGACRLASQTGAILIPMSLRCTGNTPHFEAWFGKPVPDELVHRENESAASQYLITELWENAKEHPEHLTWTAMEGFAPHLRCDRTGWP